MDLKISEIQPLTDGTWVPPKSSEQDGELIQPVGKTEQGGSTQVGKEDAKGSPHATPKQPDLESIKKLASEVQQHLSDFNIQLNFKVQSKTGQVIVQVVNRETNQVIRQIPPENLVHLREKLQELQGVLFNDKT